MAGRPRAGGQFAMRGVSRHRQTAAHMARVRWRMSRDAGGGWPHRTTVPLWCVRPSQRVDSRQRRPTALSPRRTKAWPPQPPALVFRAAPSTRAPATRRRRRPRLRQRATVADRRRDAADHGLGRHPAKRFMEHGAIRVRPLKPPRTAQRRVRGMHDRRRPAIPRSCGRCVRPVWVAVKSPKLEMKQRVTG
jgi:hypothetical protein